eukprot:898297-Rhodomonas_salina.1
MGPCLCVISRFSPEAEIETRGPFTSKQPPRKTDADSSCVAAVVRAVERTAEAALGQLRVPFGAVHEVVVHNPELYCVEHEREQHDDDEELHVR